MKENEGMMKESQRSKQPPGSTNELTFKIAYLLYIYLFQFACLDHHNYSSNLNSIKFSTF